MEPRNDEKTLLEERRREPHEPRHEVRQPRFRIEPLEERMAPGITRVGTD